MSPAAVAEMNARRRALYAEGMGDAEMAEAEGVHPSAIWAWRKRHGLAPNGVPGVKSAYVRKPMQEAKRIRLRPCLRCRRTVKSEGPHHRMCDECRKAARDLPAECTVSL